MFYFVSHLPAVVVDAGLVEPLDHLGCQDGGQLVDDPDR